MRPYQVDPIKLREQLSHLPADVSEGLSRVYQLMADINPLDKTPVGMALFMQELDEMQGILVRLVRRCEEENLVYPTLELALSSVRLLMAQAQKRRGPAS